MNFERKNETREVPRIELTSLVDVVFLLVLFFAVTTTFPTTPAGVKIKLPKMKHAKSVRIRQPVKIFIDKRGNVYWKGKKITLDKLKEVIKQNKKASVVVDADVGTEHGKVMKVLDIVKAAGAERILIGAIKNEGKKDTGLPEKNR